MTAMLDFYRQHDISPVHQDITDLPAHFARRAFLYRELGLSPMAIRDKHVLEIGPGTGENAWYTLSLKPQTYEMVEPNSVAARELEATLGSVNVNAVPIEELRGYRQFDLVLCEGLLGLCGSDPKALLEHVVTHVAVGGVLVMTCIDAISDHAEVLRRGHAQQLINRSASLADQVETLRPIFGPHLATLKGMTRSVEDWILDNLLNPASIGPTFSIPDACQALEGRFELLGCSPRFLMDWRWYKTASAGMQWAVDSYWQQAHNLLDYRVVKPRRSEALNRALMARCLGVRATLRDWEQNPTRKLVWSLPEPGWFGRGQQYLSVVRTA